MTKDIDDYLLRGWIGSTSIAANKSLVLLIRFSLCLSFDILKSKYLPRYLNDSSFFTGGICSLFMYNLRPKKKGYRKRMHWIWKQEGMKEVREQQLNINFTPENIISLIRNLNPNKAHGWDGVSARMLKICDKSIVPPLLIIFKNSLETGTFPSTWKKQILFLFTKNKKKL